jgi:multiple sugar transport system substrate-binding protein
MNMRWSRFLLVGLALSGSVLFSSCGNDDASEGAADRTIRFWHFWSEPGQKGALRELVAEFEKQRNVRVDLTELSWNDGKVKLQAAFNSGAPPDVVELGSDWVAQFSSAGVLMALPGDAGALGRFVPYSVGPGMWKGRTYAYPWTIDTRVLWVNDAVGRRPATMDDLLESAEMAARNGMYGWGANGADAHRLYKKILPFFWTYGGDVLNAQGRPVLNSAANVEALTRYADLARTGFVETQRQLDAAFIQGKVAFWNSGSWLAKKVRANPSLKATPILLPGRNGTPGVSFAGGEYLAVSAKTSNTQLARDLVLFLTNGSNAVRFCAKVPEAGFPAEKAFVADSALLTDPIKAVFAEQLAYARMTPVHPRWLDIEAVVEDAVVKVLLGEATPREALDQAQSEALLIVGE